MTSDSDMYTHCTRSTPFSGRHAARTASSSGCSSLCLLHKTSPTLLDFLTRMIHCKINPLHAKEPQPQHLTNRGVYTHRKGATKHVAVLVWHQHLLGCHQTNLIKSLGTTHTTTTPPHHMSRRDRPRHPYGHYGQARPDHRSDERNCRDH